MGLSEFISRRLSSPTSATLTSNQYFQLGFLRFSNETYGFPIAMILYVKESITNLTMPYLELITPYFNILMSYLFFIMSYVCIPFTYLFRIASRLVTIFISRALQMYRYALILVEIVKSKYSAIITTFMVLNLQIKVTILVFIIAALLVAVMFLFKRVRKNLFFLTRKHTHTINLLSSPSTPNDAFPSKTLPYTSTSKLFHQLTLETITLPQQIAYKLITSGVTLVKHGRLYTRSIRLVTISKDLRFLTWRNADENKTQALPLASFSRIDYGSRERALRYPNACLVSFIGKSPSRESPSRESPSKESPSKDFPSSRDVHFEFYYATTAEENYTLASEWVNALNECNVNADTIRGAMDGLEPSTMRYTSVPSTPLRMTSLEEY